MVYTLALQRFLYRYLRPISICHIGTWSLQLQFFAKPCDVLEGFGVPGSLKCYTLPLCAIGYKVRLAKP